MWLSWFLKKNCIKRFGALAIYPVTTLAVLTDKRDVIMRNSRLALPFQVKWHEKNTIMTNEYVRQQFLEDMKRSSVDAWQHYQGLQCHMFQNINTPALYSFYDMYVYFLHQSNFESKWREIEETTFQYLILSILLETNEDGKSFQNYIKQIGNKPNIPLVGQLWGRFIDKNKLNNLNKLYAKLVVRLHILALETYMPQIKEDTISDDLDDRNLSPLSPVLSRLSNSQHKLQENYQNNMRLFKQNQNNFLCLPINWRDKEILEMEKRFCKRIRATNYNQGRALQQCYDDLSENKITYDVFLDKAKKLLLY
jgi:hypothetical protein